MIVICLSLRTRTCQKFQRCAELPRQSTAPVESQRCRGPGLAGRSWPGSHYPCLRLIIKVRQARLHVFWPNKHPEKKPENTVEDRAMEPAKENAFQLTKNVLVRQARSNETPAHTVRSNRHHRARVGRERAVRQTLDHTCPRPRLQRVPNIFARAESQRRREAAHHVDIVAAGRQKSHRIQSGTRR